LSSFARHNLLRYSFAHHRIIYALKDFRDPSSGSREISGNASERKIKKRLG
jgi:hypothetical protein